ncbi:ubiquinol-cytochrome c reductase iron-sulfur subunit [Brevibacillus laterosporus]|uniref:Menaquinol:cytochrome c reductase iron-sulfur subunit n=2 Tax=Brevibacillus TaxID=55080 RepID=A0A0F6Y0G5_BRELA|nr:MULTISPECIES: ubiquinol-cytochrome c reductase iron-sulfur subunit [Brevibacillus]AKF95486.1 menaquinol-cytochrome C reductase [Brevibacillus laterosporus]MCR8986241.1 ubiquinol-cytochrome c reductase iron-sulfur subunit [Brevibacillus laterosporus]MCZ0831974.1 ubiquinol-cytochrome c reductase iron-sulfur subunit [Brevibacillus halotolerans]MDN9008920.1 ubiquinol-cytochrome c reductase iron-sulfur subunit [Brevibacillus laterosporus]MDO0941027.1 ubiquinol-cytochrome c reductase iron-sulfur 
MSKKEISRRTFLNYALMGTGGFLAAGMITPMIRFAIDPVLKASAAGDKVAVGNVSDFGPEPKNVNFTLHTKDGWYESETTMSAWIRKLEDGKLLALSPICKHLGCTVSWNSSEDFKNEYFCPCHFGRYAINGEHILNTPPTQSLDEYEVEIKDGKVYLGKIVPNPRPGVSG